MALNTLSISGNLTRDPDIRTSADGTTYARFSVAVNVRKKVDGEWKDVPIYVDCTAFGRTANYLSSANLARGAKVAVTGHLDELRAYATKAGEPRASLGIVADALDIMASRERGAEGARAAYRAPEAETFEAVYEDDIPF